MRRIAVAGQRVMRGLQKPRQFSLGQTRIESFILSLLLSGFVDRPNGGSSGFTAEEF